MFFHKELRLNKITSIHGRQNAYVFPKTYYCVVLHFLTCTLDSERDSAEPMRGAKHTPRGTSNGLLRNWAGMALHGLCLHFAGDSFSALICHVVFGAGLRSTHFPVNRGARTWHFTKSDSATNLTNFGGLVLGMQECIM